MTVPVPASFQANLNNLGPYTMRHRFWTAEAVSKGSYGKIKADSSVAQQRHSTVKNS